MSFTFSQIIDLGHELYTGMPVLGPSITAFWDKETFASMARVSEGQLSYHTKMMMLAEHSSTHVDAPSHYVEGGVSVDEIPLEALIVPGHLLDLTHKRAREPIGPEDLKSAVAVSGRDITPGTIVIANTGQYVHWGKDDFQNQRPYVTREGGQWLVDAGTSLFGTDLIGIDNPDDQWETTHGAILRGGVPMVQQLNNLGALVGLEFLFVALPWRMRRGTGCPVRPIAFVQ
jgi:arylformamidase